MLCRASWSAERTEARLQAEYEAGFRAEQHDIQAGYEADLRAEFEGYR